MSNDTSTTRWTDEGWNTLRISKQGNGLLFHIAHPPNDPHLGC
jgi:hypothetical protein